MGVDNLIKWVFQVKTKTKKQINPGRQLLGDYIGAYKAFKGFKGQPMGRANKQTNPGRYWLCLRLTVVGNTNQSE
jgi:hypothetical protein